MSDNNFTYKIHEHLAVLSRNEKTGWTKELNKISFCGARPRVDIREFDPSHTRMSKGISLTDSEVDVLRGLFEHGRL